MARYSAEEIERKAVSAQSWAEPDDTHSYAAMLRQAAQRERAWEQLRAWIADDAHNWSCAACGKNVYTQQLQAEMSRLDAEPEGE